jgi:hypothetical protein
MAPVWRRPRALRSAEKSGLAMTIQDADLAVENAVGQGGEHIGHVGEAGGPDVAVARAPLGFAGLDADLHAVAVELDLNGSSPARAAERLPAWDAGRE